MPGVLGRIAVERRARSRVSVCMDAAFSPTAGCEDIAARVLNLSPMGAFVEMVPVPVGTRALLVVQVPSSGARMTISVEVVREMPIGVGVRFVQMDDFARTVVRSILERPTVAR